MPEEISPVANSTGYKFKRDRFVFYHKWMDTFCDLSPNDAQALIIALIYYSERMKELPWLSDYPEARVAFLCFKNDIKSYADFIEAKKTAEQNYAR